MAVFDFIKDAPARGQTEDKRLAQIPIQRIQPNRESGGCGPAKAWAWRM